jgi:hypothetical protein
MTDEDAGGWLASRLGSARADAERIARELADRGHLTPDQSASVVAAVDAAIVSGRELLAGALREPQRLLRSLREPRTGTAPETHDVRDAGDVAGRLAAIEQRLATLEAALLGAPARGRRGSEGD